MGGLESLNFDFGVINFDTMKLIFSAIVSQILMPQGFLYIEKERKLQYQWYYNFRSYVVEMGGIEPPSESTLTETSPGADGYLNSLIRTQAVMLPDSVAS